MNLLRSILLSTSVLCFGSASASYVSDQHSNQEHMLMTSQSIILLSPFKDVDHLTAYDDHGTLLWDLSIKSKVLSWKLRDKHLFVFTKSRYLEKTYLLCIDPVTGYILWERP